MTRAALFLIVLAGVVPAGAQQPVASVQVPAIQGAAAFLEGRDVPAQEVTFLNLSNVDLMSVSIEIQTLNGPTRRSWSIGGQPVTPVPAPLRPGETGHLLAPASPDASPSAATVVLATFRDGTMVGVPAVIAQAQAQGRILEEDLLAWRTVLSAMPLTPQAEALAYLRSAISRSLTERPTDPSGLRREFETWVRGPRYPSFTTRLLENELQTIGVRLSAVQPGAVAGREPQAGRQVSDYLHLETHLAVDREYTVRVMNNRDRPIEALKVVVYDTKTGRLLRPFGGDSVDKLSPGGVMTHIAPHSLGDVGIYQPDREIEDGLSVNLEFVMWADLTWEGSPAEYQRTLTRRERRAEEFAFFLEPLKEASSLPAAQALERLARAQREFRGGPFGRQSNGLEQILFDWNRLGASNPNRLHDEIAAYVKELEQHRANLLRHLNKK